MRPSKIVSLTGALLLLAAGTAASKMYRPPVSFSAEVADLITVDRHVMLPVDNASLLLEAKSAEAENVALPYTFAHALEVDLGPQNSGTWEDLDDGSRLWRLRIASPTALSLSLGFSRFELPEGAGLWIYDPWGEAVEGPYTSRHRSSRGRLYTPVVTGNEVVIELHVPAAAAGPLELTLSRVHHGFRGFTKFHGSCNIDVICPEGDPWRDQIRSVARYSIDGLALCTGQLVNNTAENDRPFFLSAFHCDVTPENADTLVFYWKYEAPVCGQQGGGSLNLSQTGATFRAGEATSDFLLVELSEPPDPEFDVFFTGWDVSGVTPEGSVGIHHPAGHVKSISFNDDPLGMRGFIEPDTHWEVDNWENGTTEQGSSGSCLWDPATKLCVGTLTGGLASCNDIDFDIYGKLSVAWDVGDTPASRLRDWLDPLGLGVVTLAGRNPGITPPPPPPPDGVCTPGNTTLCLRDGRFKVEVSRTGAKGPGPARVVPVGNDQTGVFYFFDPENWEVLVKVLFGCPINNHYWFFAASATNVEWTITVTDTEHKLSQQYRNPAGLPAPAITDTAAFATCP